MSIRDDVVKIMSDLEFDQGNLSDLARLREDLGVDSTELVEVIVALENHFAIRLDPSDFDGLLTLGDVVAHLERALADGSSAGEVNHAAH
ncbi:acyl carrier protein [Streptomyces sp. NPDC019443]|uniref:acyl carrier protein n=1 Tax=Streptomyces sp. NPDC019443 TaxID=3365061 RepID=UPI003788BA1D